ncbi:putative receptor kinase [Turnera subulata]|uniref:Receptor kinase n=1 Tax=Turnera subulata TaxID=218843 RepID=A0A9Q0GGU5_9ROSI|nr:putative receptor kinase [Turnera subulata]
MQDLAADRAALLTLRSAVGGRTFRWNASQPTPCNWAGVKCEGNRVTVLRLPGVALTGTLPSGIFSNLTEIRTLSLRLNSLTGPLPSDLADCKTLRNLYLQGNRFSGEIPAFLFQLGDLVRLNLASNNFSGEIPTGIDKLKRLRTLYLENNQLSGSIPALELNGSIPARFKGFELSAFEGNSLCGKPLDACAGDDEGGSSIVVPSTPSGDGKPGKKKLSGGAIAGEKPLAEAENGGGGGSGYANSYSVAAAAAAAMVGSGKGADLNGGGAKKLVFFGKSAKGTKELAELH